MGIWKTASLTQCRTLTCAATVTSSYPARIVSDPPDLIKWVKREGGFVHQALNISENGKNGVGIIATQQITKGSHLIALPHHIPLKFLPSQLDDVATSLLHNLAEKVPEELWAMKLGLKLLQERAKVGSFWWPYISNLPETYSVPIFFPGDDIKNLQYAPIVHQVNKRCRFLLEFEKEVEHALKDLRPDGHPFVGQDVDASSLGWAMSAVSSRAFRLYGKRLPNGTRIDIPMMLPLIDMCNHNFNPNAKIVQEEDPGSANTTIKVVAETSINPNDPVLLNYGCLSNDLFLLDYGFVITSNPYDCIELKYDGSLLDAASIAVGVPTPKFSCPAPWQQLFLSQLNLDGETADLKVKIGGEELVEGWLLAALRVMLSSDMEKVKTHDLNTLKSLSAAAPLGIGNEIAAFRTVIALCVIALEHFPTKIMDDEALLKQSVSASTELAIQFRIQKKQVIVDVITDLSRRIKSLMSENATANQS